MNIFKLSVYIMQILSPFILLFIGCTCFKHDKGDTKKDKLIQSILFVIVVYGAIGVLYMVIDGSISLVKEIVV